MKKQELEKFNMLYNGYNMHVRERKRESKPPHQSAAADWCGGKPAFPKIGTIFVLLLLVFNLSYPQIAGATIFQPGETLTPDCAPGSANCGVATYPSSLGTTTPIANSLLTIEATSTNAILATLRGFVGQVANLFQIQDSSGSNLFSINASGVLTLGSLNGPLQANNGSVSATSSIGVLYGGTGLATAPSYGNLLVGNSSGGYTLTATSSLGLGGSSGTVTSVALTAPTGLTVTGSPITTSGTLGLSLTSGYNIPLTASTTEYDTAYSNRITSASSPLSITNHAISLSTAGDWTGTLDSQEGSYYLDARNLSNFGTPFYTFFNGTTTDALPQGTTNKYYSTNLFAASLAGTTTTALAEGANLYFTNNRVASVIAATTTTALTEGSNLYFTNARSDARFITDLAATSSVASINTLASLSLPATQLTSFGTPFSIYLSGTTTDALSQGSTNKYYSTNLFAGSLAGTTTDALAQGTTNKYYSTSLFAGSLAGTTTTALAEGSNLYFTNARSDARFITDLAATSSVNSITTLANLISTGALTSGSIGSGFGSVNIGANTFTGNGSGLTNLNANNLTNFGTPFYTYFSATTTSALTEGSNLYYTGTRVNSYIHASSTIPKTYTTNIFTGGNTFSGNLTIDTFNGPLQANGGLVSATTSVGVLYGGTGLTSLPTYGQMLVGNSNGGYTLTATSSLGLGSSSGTVSSVNASGGTTGLSFSGGPVTTSGTLTLAGTLVVANGGTGWANIASGALIYGNGTGALATTSAGTAGNILAILNGVPTWTASTTFSGGLTYLAGNVTLNTANANIWTALQQFSNASTSLFSAYGPVYFGGTATSSFSSAGALTLVSALGVGSGGTGATTFNQGWLFSSGDGNALSASTSPTVNYITATSTTATSTFPQLSVSTFFNVVGTASTSALTVSNGFFQGGLVTCSGKFNKLSYDATTGKFTCDTNPGPSAEYYTDNDATLTAFVDNDTTNLWSPATQPNIVASSTNASVLVAVNSAITTTDTGNDYYTFRVVRNTGSAASCSTSGVVGTTFTIFTTDAVSAGGGISFIDRPNTTSQVFYTLCSSSISSFSGSPTVASSTVALIQLGGADVAENYYTSDDSIESGDVVSLDSSLPAGVKKSRGPYDNTSIGVISTEPGVLLDDNIGAHAGKRVALGLIGRIPVKVVTENGKIESGDYLTTSSISGVAMKATKAGVIIGQAMTSFEGEGVGVVLMFVKNFDFGGGAVLLGDITPKLNADGSDNGLSTLIDTIQSETAHDPVAIIAKKITDGQQFLTDFISARVTAIRGYFDEVFAKKVHTEQLCVKKSDGNEACVNGDQLNSLLQNNGVPSPSPAVSGFPAPSSSTTPTTTSILNPVEVSETPTTTPEIVAPPTSEETPTRSEISAPPEVLTPEPSAPVTEQPASPVTEASQ